MSLFSGMMKELKEMHESRVIVGHGLRARVVKKEWARAKPSGRSGVQPFDSNAPMRTDSTPVGTTAPTPNSGFGAQPVQRQSQITISVCFGGHEQIAMQIVAEPDIEMRRIRNV